MTPSLNSAPLNPKSSSSKFLDNLALTGDFYKTMILTFGKPDTISVELSEKSQALRRFLAAKRPDLDREAWIHSWQAKSTMEEQIRVAILLGF